MLWGLAHTRRVSTGQRKQGSLGLPTFVITWKVDSLAGLPKVLLFLVEELQKALQRAESSTTWKGAVGAFA